MRQLSVLIAAGLVTATGCGLGAAALAAGGAPPPDTIVAVTGDADNGFEIEHYDGSGVYPPTLSESIAECGEYDVRVDRVRCRTKVRTWFRDLADLQQALDWAHAQ
jgi:hypothetical protein